MEKPNKKLNRVENLEKKEEKPFEEKESAKQEALTPEELEKYKQEGQQMIDSYHKFFMTYAKDVSLDFVMSNGFYTDLEEGRVNLDTKWFAEKDFSPEQILWGILHELSHFRDLAEDPDGMMENFEYIEGQAKKTGAVLIQKWEEQYGKSDPEFIENLKKQQPISKKDPSKTLNTVEQTAYTIHHTFFNILDDIYVNNLVARKAPKFEEGEAGGEAVKKLYKEKLFNKNDYSKLPRHLQFLYKLIREEMVKDEEVIVSPQIEEIMTREIEFQGEQYTPKEIIENFVKPRGRRDTKASQRYLVFKHTLELIFEELLMEDIEEWEPEKPSKTDGEKIESGAVNPFSVNYNELDENSLDKIPHEDVHDWMDKYQKDQKEQEARKKEQEESDKRTVEEKAEKVQENMDKTWAEKHGVSYEILQKYRQVEREVEPYLEELSLLWRKIIFGTHKVIEREIEGHFKTGIELDMDEVVKEWPKINKGDLEETRTMKRMIQKEVLVRKPELIRVRLVGDMSGSMDAQKIHILQQCLVLILSSLREFNTYLNLTRSQTKTKLETDTEAWIFGNDAEKVKSFREEKGLDDEQVEIIKIFEKLSRTLGRTNDNIPLGKILKSLTSEEREKIEQEKILEMVFEITDGGSSVPNDTRNKVNDLIELGVIARAFQIGVVSDEEKRKFNDVWNRGREEKLGKIVGENIENLLPTMVELLKEYLGDIKL